MTFAIMTDSCCDLPYTYLAEKNIQTVSMVVTMDGKEYRDDLGETFDRQWFTEQMKAGHTASTSQVNIGEFIAAFEPYVAKEQPLLYLSLSSGLSGSYGNALAAVDMLKESYQSVPVFVLDTKAASLGQGLLVHYAAELRDQGKAMEETGMLLRDHLLHIQSWVTVDDLAHLERGGRISKTSAAIGSLVNIKPIIWIDQAGKLIPVGKARGRKKSLQKIVAETKTNLLRPIELPILVAYAGDEAAGESVKQLLQEEEPAAEVLCMQMGPTIAAHTGYGAVAVFSFGVRRD